VTYDVAVSRDIAASPATLWKMVTDLPRMGEWSPENRGGSWLSGATGPAAGAAFRGVNRSGPLRWSTRVTIGECVPGEVFAFDVTFGPATIAGWRYDFETIDTGCRVTESWVDRRHPLLRVAGQAISPHDEARTRRAMTSTLAELARAAEVAPAPT
jgi:hypothetical protein